MTANIHGAAAQAYPVLTTPTCGERVISGLIRTHTFMPLSNILKTVGIIGISLLAIPCMERCFNSEPAWTPSFVAVLSVGVAIDVAAFIYGAVNTTTQTVPRQQEDIV